MKSFFILIFTILLTLSTQKSSGSNTIQLHLVPHTHNDLGWLYTVKSYFEGTNPAGCVHCILNNVTKALQSHPNRRFSYVEIGFFRLWWDSIDQEAKSNFLKLHQNGQFEFLNAGVVMNDEGAAYYDDIIEQMSRGLRFVKETFNQTVQVGWHIDPFGHSAAQASLFSQMGFNSWFFERIDFNDYNNRVAHSNMEMIWRPNTFLPQLNYLMAHVNYMSYYLAPLNWCLGVTCFPGNTPFDSMQRMFKYSTWVQNQSGIYSSNNIMHQVGGDFEWSGDAENLFEDLEVMIDFFNAHPEFNISAFFSTPRNYTDTVYNAVISGKAKAFVEKQDDFMPYVDVPHAYWTGYYTSRANYKRAIRQAGQRLQTVRKLLSKMIIEKPSYFEGDYNYIAPSLDQYEEINGILQHHDSIPGTAKDNVTLNYQNMLNCTTNDINQVCLLIIIHTIIRIPCYT